MKKLLIIHPFLFAMFPILFLFAHNIEEVPATDLLLPIVVVITGTSILFFSLRLITKSYNKSGIITSPFLILFFAYSRIRDLARDLLGPLRIEGFIKDHHLLLLLLIWTIIFIIGAFWIIKSQRSFSTSTKFLNVVAITLVAISLINIGIYEIKAPDGAPEEINKNKEGNSLYLGNPENLPDIYYIIFDTYARQDTLKAVYNYDNSEFINYLTSKGFYVASKSRSNYSCTILSMPSSLNMDYLKPEELESKSPLSEKMINSKVSRFLKAKGYRYIFVGGGFDPKGIAKYTDEYLVYKSESILRKSDFVDSLVQTTALSPFTILEGFLRSNDRKARLYAFDKLADIPNIEEPTFVYAHIMSPHPPCIFDRNGNPPKQKIYEGLIDSRLSSHERYLDQLIFINKKTKALVDELISKSAVAPIIILQADHSIWWSSNERWLNILNAYYFPEKGYDLLYESITPVNSFRIVFNLYFDANYELLKDESYFGGSWDFSSPPSLLLVPPENNSD